MRTPEPAQLIVAMFSRHAEALAWAVEQLTQLYGPIILSGEPYAFVQTQYYHATMGTELRKQLLAFRELIPPDRLAEIKRQTIALEAELAAQGRYPEPRPLNLDPGLLTLGKFMLATTKDMSHRIYLNDGIYAEVTLHYLHRAWTPWPWTYADYRLPEVHSFLERARTLYRQQNRGQ